MKENGTSAKFCATIFVIAAMVLGVASGAARAQQSAAAQTQFFAQRDNPFDALVGKKRTDRKQSEIRIQRERYVLASGERSFLFERRSAEEARLKFLCASNDPRLDCLIDPDGAATEIYVVKPTRGPRGDTIYKAADGSTLLRITSYGGATVYWPGQAIGAGASKSFGEDQPLSLRAKPYSDVLRRAAAAGAHVSAKTGSPIIFDIALKRGDRAGNAVLADAVLLAAKGLDDIASDPTGAQILSRRISKVRFFVSETPFIELRGKILRIGYVPTRDIHGRLSSRNVVQFLENTL